VSAQYDIFGTILVRSCPEAEAIIARLREVPADHVEVEVSEGGPDILAVSLEGGGSLAADDVPGLEQLLRSLGPHAVRPAILATRHDYEDGELVVAETEQEARAELSRHRLERIQELLRDVTPEDRAKLADRLLGR
jgi:hypothetical protein